MNYIAIHDNGYEVFVERVEADSREAALEVVERNDANTVVLEESEAKTLALFILDPYAVSTPITRKEVQHDVQSVR